MKYRRLGASGLLTSELSLGSWLNLHQDRAASQQLLDAAIAHGVNLFDTADMYMDGQGEAFLAGLLRSHARSRYVFATKVFFPHHDGPNAKGLSRKHLFDSVHRCLRSTQLDYIDLVQWHRFDEQTPLDESLRTMDLLQKQGKILHWGTGRVTAEQLSRVVGRCTALGIEPPVSNQHFLHLLNREAETLLPVHKELGVGLLAYSPLAQGVLTGKYARTTAAPDDTRGAHAEHQKGMWELKEASLQRVERMQARAAAWNLPLGALALRFALQHPAVASLVVGPRSVQQLETNIQWAETEIPVEALREVEAL